MSEKKDGKFVFCVCLFYFLDFFQTVDDAIDVDTDDDGDDDAKCR